MAGHCLWTGEVVVLTTVEQASGDTAATGYGWWIMTIRCGWWQCSVGLDTTGLSQNIPLQLERDGITNTYTVTSAWPKWAPSIVDAAKVWRRDQFISLMAPKRSVGSIATYRCS